MSEILKSSEPKKLTYKTTTTATRTTVTTKAKEKNIKDSMDSNIMPELGKEASTFSTPSTPSKTLKPLKPLKQNEQLNTHYSSILKFQARLIAEKMKRRGKPKTYFFDGFELVISSNIFLIVCISLLYFLPTCQAGNYGTRNRIMFANSPRASPIPSSTSYELANGNYYGHSRHPNSKHIPGNDVYSIGDIQAMTDDVLNQHAKQKKDDDSEGNHKPERSSSTSCQSVCACKWKGGKQTVECIDNQLIQIPGNIDPSTQVLDMSGNKLQTLANEQFLRSNLLNLQKLFLRNCKIGEIEPETFKGLTNLIELDLSHNLLVVVPTFALSFVSSLRDLTLSSNHIHKVEPNAFSITPTLNKLDLSHCDLQSISSRAFTGLITLHSLRLNGNKLSEILPKTLENLGTLHGIELHDNPWLCDCRMREIKVWLIQKNIPVPVAPVCSGGPERVIDKSFDQLHIDDFACKPEMLPISHYVDAVMGENASIVCRVKAVPTAHINWFWNGRLLHNNSAFSAYQRIVIHEEGIFEKQSKLVLTNAQETDSSEFFCVAENRAGSAEANFTLHVSMRAVGMAALTSGQIIALSAALVALIILILFLVFWYVAKSRRTNYGDSKTPNHLEVITTVNHQNAISNKAQASSGNGGIVIANGAVPNCIDGTDNLERKGSTKNNTSETKFTNPVQKPPRLTDLPYSVNSFENPACVLAAGPSYLSPTASAGNNPDLINDTKRFGSDEFTDLKIPPILTAILGPEHGGNSGEYSRAGGCDSLYPSGLWENTTTATVSADDLFLKRYNDKAPMMESTQIYDMQERGNDFFNKTFPRTHYNNMSSGSGASGSSAGILPNHPSTSSAAIIHHGPLSTASTTTTNLSSNSSAGAVGGYPNDYGLPLVPGAEHQHNHHLQMHPLQQLQQQLSTTLKHVQQQQQQQQQSGSSASANNSPHFSARTLARLQDANSASTSARTSPIVQASKHVLGAASTSAQGAAAAAAASAMASTSSASILPNGQPVNAKTIRVWQKGGVPVLPPVSALKRALISSSRNSPDEGYQEGGTDV